MINSDELLLVVDENDNLLKPLPRRQVLEQGLWHRTSGGMVVNSTRAQVLCQKRSPEKDQRPNLWVADFGGKCAPGEEPAATALRELDEEFGIKVDPNDLNFYQKNKSIERKQIDYTYWVVWDGKTEDLKFDRDEVSELKWRSVDEVIDVLTKQDPGWYDYGFEVELLNFLKAA